MKAAIRRPAVAESNASSAAVASRTSACNSLSSHRSSTGRAATGGASATWPGDQACPVAAAALA